MVLVTLAESRLDEFGTEPVEVIHVRARGIASVSTGTSSANEDILVRELAKRDLNQGVGSAAKPSSIETLAFGQLEGKYAVRLENGKLAELEFSDVTSQGDRPKHIDDRGVFLRFSPGFACQWLTISRSASTPRSANGTTTEVYQLVNEVSRPVANVEFHLDAAGRMLSMRVAQLQIAAQ